MHLVSRTYTEGSDLRGIRPPYRSDAAALTLLPLTVELLHRHCCQWGIPPHLPLHHCR